MIVEGEVLTMTRGDSESITVKMKNPDKTAHPFVTGDVIELTVRKTSTSEVSFHKKVIEFDNGAAIIEIEPKDTKDLLFGKYTYDVQWTNPDGKVKTIVKPAKNNFVITEEVTY